jgi:hypothetical protein
MRLKKKTLNEFYRLSGVNPINEDDESHYNKKYKYLNRKTTKLMKYLSNYYKIEDAEFENELQLNFKDGGLEFEKPKYTTGEYFDLDKLDRQIDSLIKRYERLKQPLHSIELRYPDKPDDFKHFLIWKQKKV